MLDIITQFGSFSKFEDVLLFMEEEKLQKINILDIKYCLDSIYGKGIYTISEIKSIVRGVENE